MDDAPILFCYDGSTAARSAIEAAAGLLTHRSAIVVDVGPLTVAEGYAELPSDAPDVDYRGAADALARAEKGAELARAAGFHAEARGDMETPTWRGVVEVADDIDAAVIVLGSRGLTGLHELLRGSVSTEVAQHAGRPVLIVPRRG